MAYEKKAEPLSKYEILAAGIFGQLWIIFLNILPWASFSDECFEAVLNSDIGSKSDVTRVHSCIKEHRSGLLGGCTFLLLGWPIIIAHLFFNYRMFSTALSFINFNFMINIYNISWLIVATVYCTVVPAIGIFIGYYDWEFLSNFDYIGYAMQTQFLHFLCVLIDCCYIPMGIATCVPWIYFGGMIVGWFQSKHYRMDKDNRLKLLGILVFGPMYLIVMKWQRCFRILAITSVSVLVGITLFGSFGDVFDYDKEGFFSYQGGSQYLGIILFLMWQIQCLSLFFGACRYEQLEQFMNENVQELSPS